MPNALRRLAHGILASTVYPVGSIARIRRGPARGFRYRVFRDYGIAPIFGLWEPAAQRWFVQLVRPGSTAYDVGANYGIHTLVLARSVGAEGRVIAFEPDPEVAASLRECVSLNQLDQVQIIEQALGAQSGVAAFEFAGHKGGGHLAPAGAGGQLRVKTSTLDEFVYRDGGPPPDFIKMDIEGGEADALEHGERVLSERRPKLLIELHSPDQDLRVGRVLARLGYRVVRAENGEPIKHLDRGWPDPDGMHGVVVALPE